LTVLVDQGGPGLVVIVVLDRAQMLHQLIEPLVARHFGQGSASEYLVTIASRDPASPIVFNSSPTTVEAAAADATAGMFDLRADQLAAGPGLFTAALPPPRAARLAVTIVRKTTAGDATYRVDSSDPGAWQVRVRHRAGSLDAIVAASRRRNFAIGLGVLALLAASFALVIAAAQRQQRLARQQMEFVAAVSHELRTPLAVICSAGENLADGVVSERAQMQSYGALIETEGRRLGEMVERVLQFAGISSGTTMRAHASVDVAAVVNEAVAAIAAEARDRAVTVSVTTAALPPVVGDANALRSAMQNVIGNAVKYSESGGTVEVATEPVHDGGIVRIRVADRGIGIDAADLPHIFEPFYRGRRAVDAQVRGSGVGLSVVQHVIQTHGGDVHVESRGGEGTTVTVVLPAAPTVEPADGRGRTVIRLRRGTASAES
jgi:signal transduction histidine kinase